MSDNVPKDNVTTVDFKGKKVIKEGATATPASPEEGHRVNALEGVAEVLEHFKADGIPYNRAYLILCSDDTTPDMVGFRGASINCAGVTALGYLRLSEEAVIESMLRP